jgi:hypothetical protein
MLVQAILGPGLGGAAETSEGGEGGLARDRVRGGEGEDGEGEFSREGAMRFDGSPVEVQVASESAQGEKGVAGRRRLT